jgi:hypothetical protein
MTYSIRCEQGDAMRITIDTDSGSVELDAGGQRQRIPLESAEAFEIVSEAWLRAGWDVKYIYSFTWLGPSNCRKICSDCRR